MTDLYIKGLASGNVSISGDGGEPDVNVSTNETETVASSKVIGNDLFCDSCATFITNGKIEVRIGSATGRVLTASEISERHRLSFWDAMIVTAAKHAQAKRIVTEDLDHGQTIEGIRIENPFTLSFDL